MRVYLFKDGYLENQDKFYNDFLNDNINNEAYLSSKYIELNLVEPFPFYLNIFNEEIRKTEYLKAFHMVNLHYNDLDREITFDPKFWHSLFLINFRSYSLEKYPEICDSKSKFDNIILKKFDWENYIYKILLGVEYIKETTNVESYNRYFNLIIDNLDLFNYLIKYSLTRNAIFLKNILDVIHNNDLSEIIKKNIPNRPDLGKDERYGRRVIFEFNRNYPVLMFPTMTYEGIETYFLDFLKIYLIKQNI